METNSTIEIREGEALDWLALEACLIKNIDNLVGPMTVRQYPSGNSNLTYELNFSGRKLVLRRPPFGTRPKSGHSMIREYQVMAALQKSEISVPKTFYYTDDESIVGAEFYVMEKVEGTVIHKTFPDAWSFTPEDKRALCFKVFDQLIALHNVDYKAVGLASFGRPEGYIERQIGGWNARFNKAHTPDVEDYKDIQQWLVENMPSTESKHCIVHGDFRLDNVIIGDDSEVKAVLDWEISALGDPLMDLGNTLAYWVQEDDPAYMHGMIMQPSRDEGMPTRDEILEYYKEKTGTSVENFDFYLVYGYWRNLVIVQQIYYRYYHKQTSDQRFAAFIHLVNAMGKQCRALISSSSVN